jgi:hypothetical protein
MNRLKFFTYFELICYLIIICQFKIILFDYYIFWTYDKFCLSRKLDTYVILLSDFGQFWWSCFIMVSSLKLCHEYFFSREEEKFRSKVTIVILLPRTQMSNVYNIYLKYIYTLDISDSSPYIIISQLVVGLSGGVAP